MSSLIASIAVLPVWIYHKFKMLSLPLELVNELQGILEMDVVISRTVGQLQHHRWNYRRRIAVYCRIRGYVRNDA